MTGMNVNVNKTMVVVFKNGGRLSKWEKWYLRNQLLECVPYYKYLGLMMSSRNIWSTAVSTLAIQGTKAASMVHSSVRSIGEASFKVYSKIFNAKILPILCYGSEIWGYKMYPNLENVQINFFKRFLGVRRSAPGYAVLGDCGRHTIFSSTILSCVKFWLKLLRLECNRYTKKCYDMLFQLDERGKHTWVTHIKCILNSYGFGYAWFSQDVGDASVFMSCFTQRVFDIDY